MLIYALAIDKTLEQCIFTYTDTDSLHITGDAYKKLVDMGYIVSKKEASLGKLCSDIDDEGLIIKEFCLAPKLYYYEYINNKGEIGNNMKCKGINTKYLERIDYDNFYKNNESKDIKFKSLKKKNVKLTKKDKDENIEYFSIVETQMSRTFGKTSWGKMTLKNDEFYPIGYKFD